MIGTRAKYQVWLFRAACIGGDLGVSHAHLERFEIDFEGFRGGFGRDLDGVRTSKSAALLAAPGVLEPTDLIYLI